MSSVMNNNWTDSLQILPIQKPSDSYDGGNPANSKNSTTHVHNAPEENTKIEINITSFNVLAEVYLTPRSHKNLPDSYANVVFHNEKRRELLCHILVKLASQFDILCLQEVDNFLHPVIVKCLQQFGFGYVYYPRGSPIGPIVSDDATHLTAKLEEDDDEGSISVRKSSSKDSRSDGCATFYKREKWTCEGYEIVQCDDLADNSRPSIMNNIDTTKEKKEQVEDNKTKINSNSDLSSIPKSNNPSVEKVADLEKKKTIPKNRSANHALPGITASYKRNNAAILVRLKSTSTNKNNREEQHHEIIVGNSHLYWHPGYEFVKLSQAHYLLQRMKQFIDKSKKVSNSSSPTAIVCGDMNSKPNSAVHQYFTKGNVDARAVAPWKYCYDESKEEHFSEKPLSLGGGNVNDDSNTDIVQDPIVDSGDNNNNSDINDSQNKYPQDTSNNRPRSNANDITKSFGQIILSQRCDEDDDRVNIVPTPQPLTEKNKSYEEKSEDQSYINTQLSPPPQITTLEISFCQPCGEDGPNNTFPPQQLPVNIQRLLIKKKKTVRTPRKIPSYEEASEHRSNSKKRTVRTPRKIPSYEEASEHRSNSNNSSSLSPRYLVDVTLNKFTRWLRILGLDAELETAEEEKARTGGGQMTLFEKCKKEKRTLITTSKTLLQRKGCPPGTYLVNPRTTADLEASLVHLLLLHSVKLQPRKFLTRCVVCNGTINEIHNASEKTSVFKEYGFPGFDEDLDVYRCNKCGQGYWWSDSPQSSASRVKDSAAHLLRTCVRGGVPTEGDLNFFDFVDVNEERKFGEMERSKLSSHSNGGGGIDEVMSWLQNDNLSHGFNFRSAYASETRDGTKVNVDGELLPFTNVTSDFVGALDYIFFEEEILEQKGRLFVPRDFKSLNTKQLTNGHLLPSNVWPSDHLAIGAKFLLKNSSREEKVVMDDKEKKEVMVNEETSDIVSKHTKPVLDCGCGCVPPILSLFQMAELRKQAREKAKKQAELKA